MVTIKSFTRANLTFLKKQIWYFLEISIDMFDVDNNNNFSPYGPYVEWEMIY